MPVLIAVLVLVLLLGGLGFLLKALWIAALVLLVIWLLGFVFRTTPHTGPRRRWYRW